MQGVQESHIHICAHNIPALGAFEGFCVWGGECVVAEGRGWAVVLLVLVLVMLLL